MSSGSSWARASAALVVALACAACAEAPVTAVGPRPAPMVPAAAMRAPEARAGTAFEVRLDAAIDSRLTRPGSPFSVTVTEPVRSPDGFVVLPRGTRLVGTVAGTGPIEAPHLSLRFERVVVGAHSQPVAVRVRSADVDRYEPWSEPPGYAGYEDWMQSMPQYSPHGYATPYQAPGPEQLVLRQGARMQLELTLPLASMDARALATPASR